MTKLQLRAVALAMSNGPSNPVSFALLRDPGCRSAVIDALLEQVSDAVNVEDAATRLGVSRPSLLKLRKQAPEIDALLRQRRYKRRPRNPVMDVSDEPGTEAPLSTSTRTSSPPAPRGQEAALAASCNRLRR